MAKKEPSTEKEVLKAAKPAVREIVKAVIEKEKEGQYRKRGVTRDDIVLIVKGLVN